MSFDSDTLIRVGAVLVVALVLTRAAVWLSRSVRARIDRGDGDATVAAIAREVAGRMGAEPEYRELINGPVEVLGVDDFADSAVTLKLYLETVPGSQWTVGREYRRRLKLALEEKGIGIPDPHRTVILRGEGGEGLLRSA
jgi:small-conductance mechanosensitive channel